MHRHRGYLDFGVFGVILVDDVEEPEVFAMFRPLYQLRVTIKQFEILKLPIYADAATVALDHLRLVKPHKALAAVVMLVSNERKLAPPGPVINLHEVTTTVHQITRRDHKPELGEVAFMLIWKAWVLALEDPTPVPDRKILL